MYFASYNKDRIAYAKELRRNMTPHERKLWYRFLKSYKPRFYSQHAVGEYILDFYCPAVKLAVELDGSQHYDPEIQRKDALRTENLNSVGIAVLRFSNAEINRQFTAVCECIDREVKNRIGE